jgi:DNA processing protein
MHSGFRKHVLQSSPMSIPVQELKFWISFARISGSGRVRSNQLLGYFGRLSIAWKAIPCELSRAGLDFRCIRTLNTAIPGIEPDREIEQVERYHIRAVPFIDDNYPRSLREIYDYPPVVFIRGTASPSLENGLAVVGTRRITAYGRQVTKEIVESLVNNGLTIVGGLARGIHTVAHRVALESGCQTLAVCACGLDTVYPAENSRLASAIMEHGALVSEHPLGVQPKAEHFPLRNRIMSGLCRGVLVVEAGEASGVLITARQPIDQDRGRSLQSRGPFMLRHHAGPISLSRKRRPSWS